MLDILKVQEYKSKVQNKTEAQPLS